MPGPAAALAGSARLPSAAHGAQRERRGRGQSGRRDRPVAEQRSGRRQPVAVVVLRPARAAAGRRWRPQEVPRERGLHWAPAREPHSVQPELRQVRRLAPSPGVRRDAHRILARQVLAHHRGRPWRHWDWRGVRSPEVRQSAPPSARRESVPPAAAVQVQRQAASLEVSQPAVLPADVARPEPEWLRAVQLV